MVCLVFSELWEEKSERDKVGGKDTDAPISQLPLPPVVLGVCPGDDSDAVASSKAQVSGLLARERVGRRDNQLPSSSAHWRSIPWRKNKTLINFYQT